MLYACNWTAKVGCFNVNLIDTQKLTHPQKRCIDQVTVQPRQSTVMDSIRFFGGPTFPSRNTSGITAQFVRNNYLAVQFSTSYCNWQHISIQYILCVADCSLNLAIEYPVGELVAYWYTRLPTGNPGFKPWMRWRSLKGAKPESDLSRMLSWLGDLRFVPESWNSKGSQLSVVNTSPLANHKYL